MFGSRNFRDEARPSFRLLLPSLILLYTGFLISLPKSINAAPQRPELPPTRSQPFPNPTTDSNTPTSISDASTSTSDVSSTSVPDVAPTSTYNAVSTSTPDASLSASNTASTSVPTGPVSNLSLPATAPASNLSWLIVVAVILFFIGFFTFYCVWRTRRKLRSEKDFDPGRIAPDTITAQTKNDSPPVMADLRNSSNQLGSSTGQMVENPRSTSPESSTELVANQHSTSSLGSSVEQLTNDEGHQSVFTEQTFYGTHAASTSSLDLSTTTNYPYLQQHHFTSSDQ